MPFEVDIRRCAPGDETMLSVLGGATFLETYAGYVSDQDILAGVADWHPPSFYHQWLRSRDVDVWVAEVTSGRAAIGYVALVPDDAAPGARQIKRIYLFHRFQGTGVGKRLMETAIAGARQRRAPHLSLDVAEFNEHAIAFYTSFGFRIVRTGAIAGPQQSYPIHTLALSLA